MKKFISLLLVCIMLTSLIGCSPEEIEDAKELINKAESISSEVSDWYEENESLIEEIGKELSELEENNRVDDDVITDNDNQMWTEKEISVPNIPAIAVKENYIDEDTVKKTYSTFFDFTAEDVRSAVRNNDFLSENFLFADMLSEGIENERFKDLGDKQWYCVREGVLGAYKPTSYSDTKYYNELELFGERNTDYADNYDYLIFSISEIETDTIWQKNMCSVLTDLVGQEIAEYICYAKDPDGKIANSKKYVSEFCLNENVKTDGGQYRFIRNVSENYITIVIRLDEDSIERSYYAYFDGGYVPTLHKDEKNLNNVFSENRVGNLNFDTTHLLFDKYFKNINSDYVRSLINSLSTEKRKSDNGITIYDINTDVMGVFPKMGTVTSPELDVDCKIIVKEDGSVSEIEIEISGRYVATVIGTGTDEEKEQTYNQMLAGIKEQISLLFPEIDLSGLTMKELSERKWVSGTYNLNGLDYKWNAKVATGTTFAETYDSEFNMILEYNEE